MAIERILGTDAAKVAFEKADRNFVGHETQINNVEMLGYVNSINVSGLDTHTITKNGKYWLNGGINMPLNAAWQGTYWLLEVTILDSNALVQMITCIGGSALVLGGTFRQYCFSGVWSGWQKIVTDKQEPWISPTLLNGWVQYTQYPLRYFKDALGIVHVNGQIQNGTPTNDIVVMNLPVGYRPSNVVRLLGVIASHGTMFYHNTQVNGDLTLYGVPYTGTLAFNYSFRAT